VSAAYKLTPTPIISTQPRSNTSLNRDTFQMSDNIKYFLLSSSVALIGVGVSLYAADTTKYYWAIGSVILGACIWFFLRPKKKKSKSKDGEPEKPISVGIIGLDSEGQHFASSLLKDTNTRLTAISDTIQPADLSKFGSAKFFSNPKALIDSGLVDALFITTPVNSRIEIIEHAASKKKSVLVDGPAGISVGESQRAKKTVIDNNTHLYFSYSIPFKPSFLRVKEMLQQNLSTGDKIKTFNVTYNENIKETHKISSWIFNKGNSGGGCLMNSGISIIAFLEDIFGKISPSKVKLSSEENMSVETKAEIDFVVENEPTITGHFSQNWISSSDEKIFEFFFSSGKKVVFDVKALTVTYIMDTESVVFEIRSRDAASVSVVDLTYENIVKDSVKLFRDTSRNFSKLATGPFVTVLECYEKAKMGQ